MADKDENDDNGPSGWVIAIIVIILLIILAAAGWIVFTRLRARRLGLPTPSLNPFANRSSWSDYPSPAPGGIVGWVNGKIRSLRNRRTAGGAYEGTSSGAGPARRFGPLDPDEAWDTRVGNEADAYGPSGYYEEQELGVHNPGSYAGASYGEQSYGLTESGDRRGRSRTRELDERYDEEMGGRNPFGDNAEPSSMSLRGVSPRPIDSSAGGGHQAKGSVDSKGDSPTERKSMFRENM